MIDALYPDAPENVTQEEMDASLTLHEAKQWGYWPGETPGTAEEYMTRIRTITAIHTKWKAAFAEARERGASAGEIMWMNRNFAAEIKEQDELWFHGRRRQVLAPVAESERVAARIDALF